MPAGTRRASPADGIARGRRTSRSCSSWKVRSSSRACSDSSGRWSSSPASGGCRGSPTSWRSPRVEVAGDKNVAGQEVKEGTMDIVIGRSGDSLSGTAMVKAFRIQSSFGTLTLEKKRIAWIHFGELDGGKLDEVWLRAGDRLAGKVLGASMRFKASGGNLLTISYEDVHTLMLNTARDARAARLGR